MQIETSLRRIREVVTRPEVFSQLRRDLESTDDYLPNPSNIHFAVGDGLIIYEPNGYLVELNAAISPDDWPENPKEELQEQWDYLAGLGFIVVYALVQKSNKQARHMARSMGMDLHSHGEINIYKKVIRWQ